MPSPMFYYDSDLQPDPEVGCRVAELSDQQRQELLSFLCGFAPELVTWSLHECEAMGFIDRETGR